MRYSDILPFFFCEKIIKRCYVAVFTCLIHRSSLSFTFLRFFVFNLRFLAIKITKVSFGLKYREEIVFCVYC